MATYISAKTHRIMAGLAALCLVFGAFQSVGAASISVATGEVLSLRYNKATLAGQISVADGTKYKRWFEYGIGSSLGSATPRRGPYVNSASFHDNTGFKLTAGTTYSYRVAAINVATNEVVYGDTRTFTTPAGEGSSSGAGSAGTPLTAPTVNTYSPTDVNGTSAVLSGYFDARGDNSAERWFEWGTTQSLGKKTLKVSVGSPGKQTQYLTGLTPETNYFVRAAAGNKAGVTYGATLLFRTTARTSSDAECPCEGTAGGSGSTSGATSGAGGASGSVSGAMPLAVSSSAKPATTQTSATLSAFAFPGGLSSTAWYEWGTTASLGNSTESQSYSPSNSITVKQNVSGLKPGTKYYYRLIVRTDKGTVASDIQSFSTSGTSGASSSGQTASGGGNSAAASGASSGGLFDDSTDGGVAVDGEDGTPSSGVSQNDSKPSSTGAATKKSPWDLSGVLGGLFGKKGASGEPTSSQGDEASGADESDDDLTGYTSSKVAGVSDAVRVAELTYAERQAREAARTFMSESNPTYSWGRVLGAKYFSFDDGGAIVRGFYGTKFSPYSALATPVYARAWFIPDTFTEWFAILLILAFVMYRARMYVIARSRRSEEEKARKKEEEDRKTLYMFGLGRGGRSVTMYP